MLSWVILKKNQLSFLRILSFSGFSVFGFILCQRALPPRCGCRWRKRGNSLETCGQMEPENFAIWPWTQRFWHTLRSDVCNWHQAVHGENMTSTDPIPKITTISVVQVAVPNKVLTHGWSVDPQLSIQRQGLHSKCIRLIDPQFPVPLPGSRFPSRSTNLSWLCCCGLVWTTTRRTRCASLGRCSHDQKVSGYLRRIWDLGEKLQDTPHLNGKEHGLMYRKTLKPRE